MVSDYNISKYLYVSFPPSILFYEFLAALLADVFSLKFKL